MFDHKPYRTTKLILANGLGANHCYFRSIASRRLGFRHLYEGEVIFINSKIVWRETGIDDILNDKHKKEDDNEESFMNLLSKLWVRR